MNDTDTIKALVNLRDIARGEIGYQPKTTTAKYDLYKCPFHHENKGYSFVVYNDHWQCHGKCSSSGDVFSFFKNLNGWGFREAKNYVLTRYAVNQPSGNYAPAQPSKPLPLAPSEPPGAEWQHKASEVVIEAKLTLWSDKGVRAFEYLRKRGLTPETIDYHDLGYIPGNHTEWLTIGGLKVPPGITIPWQASGALWGVKVRRAAGEKRYEQIAGGNIKGCLYLADEIRDCESILIDEGELNALSVWQAGREKICPVAIGSTGNADISSRWYPQIALARAVFIRMDSGSGDKALEKLQRLTRAAYEIQVPEGYKDPNEFLLGAGAGEVSDWLDLALWEVM